MSVTQLNPCLPVYVVDKGNGLAHALIDYGPEHSLLWVIFMDEDGECWCVPNEEVRGKWNRSMQRLPQ